MTYVDNSNTDKELNEAIRGNAVTNIIPKKIADFIQPVININPKDYKLQERVITRSSAGTIYTTPTDKDFYLTGIHLSATCVTVGANGNASVSGFPEGITSATTFNSLVLSPTAIIDSSTGVSNLMFQRPIKCARNTAIVLNVSSVHQTRAVIFGYEE